MQAKLDTLSDYYERLVRSAYKNRNAKVWYMYILASDDLGQAFRRYGYLRDLSKQMNIQAGKIIETRDSLEKEKEALAELRKEAESVRSQRLADMGKLQAEQNDSQKLVNQLKKDKKKYQQDLSKKQKEVEALNREIQRIINQALNDKESPQRDPEGRPPPKSLPNLLTTLWRRSSSRIKANCLGRLKELWWSTMGNDTTPSIPESQTPFQQRCFHSLTAGILYKGSLRR